LKRITPIQTRYRPGWTKKGPVTNPGLKKTHPLGTRVHKVFWGHEKPNRTAIATISGGRFALCS